MDDRRPDPEALLLAASGEGRGRLKVFLGAAPGVGKTWEMLNQAQRRLDAGADVLAGVVETHGRAGTEAEAARIPVLPRRFVPYRGQALAEFDLDAALRRRPGLLLVDELAHTNAHGSRHAKRWEDVEELLAAGIDVWATLNVQHLESLNEDIARITGVRVAETLPDRVLDAADEIELIDVPPAELRARLADGRIYRPETARRALDGFFKESNLAALREVALRRTAQHVDDDVRDWMRRAGVSGPFPAGDRVLALVGPAGGAAVVRQAKRLAEALHAPWTVLHVERDNTLPAARPTLELAAQLGADVQTRIGTDIVRTALDLARAINATHLVLGRGVPSAWRRVLGRTPGAQMLRRAPDFAVYAVPMPGIRRPRVPRIPEGWLGWCFPAVLLPGITGLGALVRTAVPGDAMGLLFLASVMAVGAVGGLRPALAAALAAFVLWDFFFLPPLYTLTIGSVHDILALFIFAAVAVASGSLAGRLRAQGRAAQARIEGLRRIGTFSRKLGEAATEPELLAEVARQGAATGGGEAVVLGPVSGTLSVLAREPEAAALDEGALAAANWTAVHNEPAGRGTPTLPSADWRFLPVRTLRAPLGVLGIRSPAALNEPQLQAFGALADQAASAWERVRLAADTARTRAAEETQQLRTALLASLGHDLRTPLTAIGGAAGTLRGGWARLDETTRDDLLELIEQDVGRMSRFLSNITELTRLESGQVRPHLQPVPMAEAAEAAVALLAGSPLVSVGVAAPEPMALADPVLLERVLVNLLENAVKYSPDGSLVQLRCAREAGRVVVRVIDEGVGIPPEDQALVFDSFFRVTRRDRVTPGTGLGLAIARGLLAAMGGDIAVQSPRHDLPEDGLPGTAMVLRLPEAAASVPGNAA